MENTNDTTENIMIQQKISVIQQKISMIQQKIS